MKKFIHVLENEIIARYVDESPRFYGGTVYEVPEEVELFRAAIREENGEVVVYQRPLTIDEEFQIEVQESIPYHEDILKGQRAIAFFRLLNDKKGLSEQQKLALIADEDIQHIIMMLSLGKLDEAALQIEAILVDGVSITEEDKIKMIKFLGV